MSEQGGSPRTWAFYIEDMQAFSGKVLAYKEGMDQQQFEADQRTYDATLRNLELIGEAATHVPEEVRASRPDIPWRLIIATRNRLIHAYLGIDNDTVWSIIRTDVPDLRRALDALITDLK